MERRRVRFHGWNAERSRGGDRCRKSHQPADAEIAMSQMTMIWAANGAFDRQSRCMFIHDIGDGLCPPTVSDPTWLGDFVGNCTI
jgi:hypothetical protein